jgi:hypothetical protein
MLATTKDSEKEKVIKALDEVLRRNISAFSNNN